MELVRIVIMTHSKHRYEASCVNNNLRARPPLTSSKPLAMHVITVAYAIRLDVRALQLDCLHIISNHQKMPFPSRLLSGYRNFIFCHARRGKKLIRFDDHFKPFSPVHKFQQETTRYSATSPSVLLSDLKSNLQKIDIVHETQLTLHPI